LKKGLAKYLSENEEHELVIKSRIGMNRPITSGMANKILMKIAREFNLKKLYCNSMRKSFGYHFYQRTKDMALLQKIFNHIY
jgi:Phage integrase family